MERGTALSEFDSAREAFLRALEAAPDEALGYLRAGDIYAVGGLAVHCNRVLKHYQRVLEKLVERGAAEFRAFDPAGEKEEANRRALAGLAPAERAAELAELESLHQRVKQTAGQVPPGDWERKTPVYYGDAADAYPTSADDVIGWLRDHYREHVPQVRELVAEWRAVTVR